MLVLFIITISTLLTYDRLFPESYANIRLDSACPFLLFFYLRKATRLNLFGGIF